MKGLAYLSGLLAGGMLVMAPPAWAGESCQAPAGSEVVVVMPESAEAGSRLEILVTGGSSQGVRVEAPSAYVGTAVGGAGAAGVPGASAQ